jgi:cell wall-associated NlpC family hydrolase
MPSRPDIVGVVPAPDGLGRSPQTALVDTALGLLGVPYRNGGADLAGFDCSGFTQYVFWQHGVPLPREVRDQFRFGEAIRQDNVAPGDLIFFRTTGRRPSHVAIALDDTSFVHAPASEGVVRVERLDSAYWSRRVAGVRRVPHGDGAITPAPTPHPSGGESPAGAAAAAASDGRD